MLLETYRECVREVFDLEAATAILQQVQRGAIRVTAVDSAKPSPYASALLFSYIAISNARCMCIHIHGHRDSYAWSEVYEKAQPAQYHVRQGARLELNLGPSPTRLAISRAKKRKQVWVHRLTRPPCL